VLFRVFNVFNARAEKGTSFNKRFLDNRMLWLSLAVAIYWDSPRCCSALFPWHGWTWE
jgi:hypothetical protein